MPAGADTTVSLARARIRNAELSSVVKSPSSRKSLHSETERDRV
jgi:hypothetical protein